MAVTVPSPPASGVQLASFDVFDTVVTRALGSPESVFLALGRRLASESLIHCSPEAFARARMAAERRAYRNADGECDFRAIYVELRAALGMSESQAEAIVAAEQTLERALMRAVPLAAERIEQARAAGHRIVFVSDMYLPAEFVRVGLAEHGLWREGDQCYVSCERGRSKRRGLLCDMLADQQVPARLSVHHGNSREHDLLPAKKGGLRVVPLLEANLNRYEALLEQHTWATEGLASALAGASRLARLTVSSSNAKEAALRDVAAGVAAPTLVGYVLWLLRRAAELGLRRLYFLSRDGQILLDIARRLSRALDMGIELRYLYGSRQAWNLAAVTSASDDELEWVWDTTDFLSTRSVLARVGLQPEDVGEALAAAGFTSDKWDRSLVVHQRDELRELLQAEPVRCLILERARELRGRLLAYLTQEGVFVPESWGLVDLGWFGSLQNALSSLVAESGGVQPVGFYFALFSGAIADCSANRREAYYADERRGSGYVGAVSNLIPLMEMFCAGDHGTVVDFAVQEDGCVTPILKEPVNRRVKDWGLPIVRRAIDTFADNLVLQSDLVSPWSDVRDAVTDVLRAFWLTPSREIALAWADFPWEDGLGRESYSNRLAQAYGWTNVLRTAYLGHIDSRHRAAWVAGSMRLSPRIIRFAMARVFQLQRVLRAF